MSKWLKRFTGKADENTDTLRSMSIVSVLAPQPSTQTMPIVSTVSVSVGDDMEKYREQYQERTAIMQHDSGWPESEASHWSLQAAVFAWVQDHHPDIVAAISGSFPAVRYAGTQGPTFS